MNSTGEGTAFSVEPENGVFLSSKLSKDNGQEMYPAQVQGSRTRKLPKGKDMKTELQSRPGIHLSPRGQERG